jgi:diguanylate cyclase (GGDEF)-like protein
MAYIDINDFKGINDKFGHHMGDEVLMQVGKTIATNLRATDISGRLGGDEFAVLLPFTNERVSRVVLRKIELGLMGMAKANEWPIGFSIGSLTFLRPPTSVEEMINGAEDRLMYEVKNNRSESFQHEVVRVGQRSDVKTSPIYLNDEK